MRGWFNKHVIGSHKTSVKQPSWCFNSNLKKVFDYESKCWRITQNDIDEVEAFHYCCLRTIHRIIWLNKITNKNLLYGTSQHTSKSHALEGLVMSRKCLVKKFKTMLCTGHYQGNESQQDPVPHVGEPPKNSKN